MKRTPCVVDGDVCTKHDEPLITETYCASGRPHKRKGRGRPPRAGKAALERVEIRVTKAELLAWRRSAKDSGMTLSEWLRWCAANFAPDE